MDLAGLGAGEVIDHRELAGIGVRAYPATDAGAELVEQLGGRLGAVGQAQIGFHHCSLDRVGDSDGHGLEDGRMRCQRLLDLTRSNAIAAALDHVVGSAHIGQSRHYGVERPTPDVASVQVPARHPLGIGVGVVPIADARDRVGELDADLACFSVRHDGAVLVAYCDRVPGIHGAERVVADSAQHQGVSDQRVGFGLTESVVDDR